MRFARAVRRTADFRRIEALPRRVVTRKLAESLVSKWTQRLAVPGSGGILKPWQAMAFEELEAYRGALLGYPVGLGKTLISALAPVVLGSKRAVLIIPAALKEKTYSDFAALRGKWRLPSPFPRILTREELQTETNALLLWQIKPDLITVDEADDLANSEASVPTRISRYRTEAGEDCVVLAMTGSLARKSIMGYWHLLLLCLGSAAPVPLDRTEAKDWAKAIDEGIRGQRPHPGPLGATVEEARAWFASRTAETPGVILVDEDSCSAPLDVRVRIAPEDKILDGYYKTFLTEFTNPDGFDVTDPLSRFRMDQQMGGAGMYLLMDPPPPKPWADARRTFAKFVRAAILHSRNSSNPIETEAQVVRRYRARPEVTNWIRIEPTFTPHTRPVWLTESLLEAAEAWLAESDAPGVVWYGVVEFGDALMRRTGLPRFGPGGKDQQGRGLHVAPPGNVIVSWNANKRGFNLQRFKRMLIMQPPSSAKYLEQIIGRSHRQLQFDRVAVDLMAGSGGALDAIASSIREAEYVRDTLRMTQKVLRANVGWGIPAFTKSNRFRWARRSNESTE